MAIYLNLSNYRLEKIGKKGEIKDVSIGIKLIWIYKSLDDCDVDSIGVFRIYGTDGSQKEIEVPLSIVQCFNDFKKILSKNLLVVSDNDEVEFMNYINKEIKDLELHMSYDYLTNKLGWQNDSNGSQRFILKSYEPSYCPRIVNNQTDFEFTKGSIDEQLEFINQEILPYKNTRLALVIGASSIISSYLNSRTNIGTLVINVCGKSSTGKSTIVDLSASLFGSPETSNYGLVRTFNATKNFILGMCESRNGIPIILDDVNANGQEHNISDLIYQLAMGEPRGRCNQNGAVQQKRSSWSGIAIITSEYSLLEQSVVSLGGHARTLTLEEVQWTNDAEHSDRIKIGVRNNFGYLGQMIADVVANTPMNDLLSKFNYYNKQILSKMKIKDNLSSRIASKLTPIIMTAELIKDLLNSNALDVQEILDMIVELEQSSIKQRDIGDIVYDLMVSFINQEFTNFTKSYDMDIPQKEMSITDNSKFNQILNKHYGHIHISESDSYVLFDALKFEELLRKSGYSNQRKSILDTLETKKVLLRTERDRQISKATNKMRAKHYKFSISEFNVSAERKTPNMELDAPKYPLDLNLMDDIDEIFE